MYNCKTCSKEYSSRATLSRHERNHRDDANFRCMECSISFRRRDLLNRHMQIHDGSQSKSTVRRRSHTACQRCRVIRCKCDGAHPCSACHQASEQCIYPGQRWRTSQREWTSPPTSGTSIPSASDQSTDGYGSASGTSDMIRSASMGAVSMSVDHGIDPLVPSSLLNPNIGQETGDSMLTQPGQQNFFDQNLDFNSYPFAWQYSHEQLFFPGDNSGFFGGIVGQSVYPDGLYQGFGGNNASGVQLGQPSILDQAKGTAPNISGPSITAKPMAESQSAGGRQIQAELCKTAGLKEVIDSMINIADRYKSAESLRQDRHWSTETQHLTQLLESSVGGDRSVVDEFIDQYFDNFHPLWQLVPPDPNVRGRFHPLLFLTVASIGALYSSQHKATCGSLLHIAVRGALMDSQVADNCTTTELLDIGKAMLLTQVAALYFEQESAFSFAERLGATLLSLAHRTQLLTRVLPLPPEQSGFRGSPEEETMRENQRMLVYGMLRAETFLSILFNRKPRLSFEEIYLPLPSILYNVPAGIGQSIPQHGVQTPCEGLTFSELVLIFLDDEEQLPQMRPVDLELLIFGLQYEVWRFCNGSPVLGRGGQASADLLDLRPRRMAAFERDRSRMMETLGKWRQTLQSVQRMYSPEDHRSTYLSGLILHDLSFLRMCAPIQAIQQAAYYIHDSSGHEPIDTQEISDWAHTGDAKHAVEHIRSIWIKVKNETNRTGSPRTKFNIMILITLYHSAAVIWAIAGSESHTDEQFIQTTSHGNVGDTRLRRNNTSVLMNLFADLFRDITSTWGLRSSFATMILKLADNPLPAG